MSNNFMIASSIFFILCLFQVPTTNASISCYETTQYSAYSNATGCDYCGYIEVQHSTNQLYPNFLKRTCIHGDAQLPYTDGPDTKKFDTKNLCQTYNDNYATYLLQICETDFCNEKCENKNGALSLSLSFLGLMLSILIPLKFI